MSNLNIKHLLEEKEELSLDEKAQKSKFSKGREYPLSDEIIIQTEYMYDKDKILHSKAFRRLKHKTQVFFSPNDDHYRTRLTHTLEVAYVAVTIARALNLNTDLTEAIALGHDLGHTPFGHTGEHLLNSLMKEGFQHAEQSIRIVKHLEKLNLTQEVIDGIKHHNGCVLPSTLEGQIVKIADRIAYINHDIDDAIRAGIIIYDNLPKDCMKFFTQNQQNLVNNMIYNVIVNSLGADVIKLSPECIHYMNKLRTWLFDNVYINSKAKDEEKKTKKVVEELFFYYMRAIIKRYPEYDEIKVQRAVCDYLSGMSDRYAVQKYNEYFMPKFIQKEHDDSYLFELFEYNENV